jgi:UDP-N-acetylglucosamine 2-epimerase
MIEAQTKVAPALQKVLIKGIQKDEVTLKSLGVGPSTKIMVIGSSFDDVMAVSKPPDKEALAAEEATASKESNNWCSLTQHKKIIDKVKLDEGLQLTL